MVEKIVDCQSKACSNINSEAWIYGRQNCISLRPFGLKYLEVRTAHLPFSHSWTIPQAFGKVLFVQQKHTSLKDNNIDTARMWSDYFLASIVVLINRVSTESLYERGGTCADSGMLRVNVRLICGQWCTLKVLRASKTLASYYCAKSLYVIYANKKRCLLHFPLSSTHAHQQSIQASLQSCLASCADHANVRVTTCLRTRI
jgi:hypothetical protein